jgi:Histidine kinase
LLYDAATGYYWLPDSRGGVALFNKEKPNRPVMRLLENINTNYFFKDRDQNIWCGTYGYGVFLFPRSRITSYGKADGLRDSYVTHISKGKGQILNVSCVKYFYEFDGRFREYDQFFNPNENKPQNKCMVLKNGRRLFLSSGRVITEDASISYRSSYFSILYDLLEYKGDTLLAGLTTGVDILLLPDMKTVGKLEAVDRVKVYTIKSGSGKKLWLGTQKGLFRNSGGQWRHFTEKDGLGSATIYDLFPLPDGRVYCATSAGVSIVYPDEHIEQIADSLIRQQEIKQVLVDARGVVWMATQNGLFCYDKNRLLQVDVLNGLIANEVNALFNEGDTVLYVGTSQGISRIPMQYVTHDLAHIQPGDVLVERLLVNGKEKTLTGGVLSLSPEENDLVIALSATNFLSPALIRYEYSLDEGVSWSSAYNRQIVLPSLSFGAYRLLIRARHRNGNVSAQLVELRFDIRTPLYRNIFFLICCGLALLLLTSWLIVRFYRNRRRREQEQMGLRKQLLDLEQKAMVALLNPHFVFNAINSINYYINNKEEEKYAYLLTNLSRLIRMNLNNTYKNSVSLSSELQIISLYVEFEQHRFIRQPLRFTIENNCTIPATQVFIPPMMIQPFIENAIWHGVLTRPEGGHVWLRLYQEEKDYLVVEIEDDGYGTGKLSSGAKEGVRGIGLILQRVRAYNQLHAQPIRISLPDYDHLPTNQPVKVIIAFPLVLRTEQADME